MAFFSHPDDELFSAGILRRAAEAGLDIHVLYTTSGDLGQDKAHRGLVGRVVRKVTRPKELPRLREKEAQRALEKLGLPHPPVFFRFRDSYLTHRLFKLAERIQGILRSLDPDLVLTMGPQGVTGHRDHIATSNAVQIAFQRMDPRARLLQVVVSPERAQLFRGLWELKTVAPEVIDHRIPVASLAEVRAASLACYRTQFTLSEVDRFRRQVFPRDQHEELQEVLRKAEVPPLPF